MSFFQGSLQEGIAAALQQAKAVVCFVTDGEAESKLWEDEYLAEEEISSLLQSQSVALRLAAGSQEEGFLAQLYPIPKKPTIVIIKNGELREYIAAGVTRDVFTRRMRTALAPSQPAPAPAQPQPAATPAAPPSQPSHTAESSASSSGQATPPTPSEQRVQSLLAERAARLAEERKRAEEEAKRQRADKAKAKAQAEASGAREPDAQSKHAEALRKKQREAREERQRIIKAIEDDKAARRARQTELEAARKAVAAADQTAAPAVAPPMSQLAPSASKMSEHCALQVRLFDGSTIRRRFSSAETLGDVRRWVDEARGDGRAAYTFKVLLTPLPSKRIDVAEEGKSLQALDLAPSSTLILVPVPKQHAAAYGSAAAAAPGQQGNAFQRLIAYVLAIVTGFFSAVVTFFSTLFSTNGPQAAPEPAAAAAAAISRTSQSEARAGAGPTRRGGRRIAGLEHSDERRNDQQFYNGNSTNFEPRPDDEE